jgi:hypothetical protein
MDICEQIRAERAAGITRCFVLARAMNVREAARAFGLCDDVATYRVIQKAEADTIACQLLQTSLAYRTALMTAARASQLWEQFLELFAGQAIQFATNLGEVSGCFDLSSEHAFSFSPATTATLDLGVIVLGTSNTGCLWVEEED